MKEKYNNYKKRITYLIFGASLVTAFWFVLNVSLISLLICYCILIYGFFFKWNKL